MSKISLKPINRRLEILLANVGDMSLKRRAREIIKEIDPHDSDNIMDLGCGTGYYLFLLSSLPVKLNLIGLDSDKKALEEAKESLKNRKIRFILGDSHKLPFKENTFDKIVASEVLEHLDNDEKALKEMYRVLKRGGVLVVSVPSINYPFFWDPINWLLQYFFGTHIKGGFFSGIWSGHLRLYKIEELKKKFKRADFTVEIIKELTFWCLPFNHYIVNIVARLLYDVKISSKFADNLSKFKETKRSLLVNLAFGFVNLIDKLNTIFPQRNGVNIFVKAIKKNH